ncbi:MAG: hypothetical protein FD188_512 [Ignavibacteria bacterium]|nr:MAG: hypothetical protein FD188_512 [Ignavibacteria bacterium]
MKKQFLLSVLLVLNLQIFAQNKSQLTATPAVKIPITVSDGAGGSQILHFGLDKTATDGLDASLEEQALPPLPPAGVFDARFNLNATEASLIDIRHALNAPYFTGSKVHEIQYQVGTGTTITISWNLPAGVTGKLQDVVLGTIIDVAMNSAGSYTVNNPGVFNKLKLTIEYKLLPPTATKYIITPSDLNPVAGSNITVTAQLASDNGTSVAEAEKIITWSKTGTGGSFGSPTSTTDANGKATVQFTTHTVAGTIHKITGTTGTLTGTSSDITTKAGAYAKLKVTAAPLDPVAGEKSVITVQLQDVNGNDVKEAKQINFVSTKGTIAPNAMTDAGTGSVSVDLTTDTKSGINHTVTATDNVDNAIKTDSPLITTKAGAYAKLKITASTVTPVAGGQLG